MLEDIGKKVKTMPQIKIDDELIGGYHQLVEYFDDKGLVNFRGEKVERKDKDNVIFLKVQNYLLKILLTS